MALLETDPQASLEPTWPSPLTRHNRGPKAGRHRSPEPDGSFQMFLQHLGQMLCPFQRNDFSKLFPGEREDKA